MMNTNYKEMNIDELAMVTGGAEVSAQEVDINVNDWRDPHENGIPRGGRFGVRV